MDDQSLEPRDDAAVNSTMGGRTAQLSLTGSTTVDGLAVKEIGSGAVDFTQNVGQLTITVSAAGPSQTIQSRFLAGTEYVELPALAAKDPGKSWISFNLSALQSGAGTPAGGGATGNPAAMLHLLAQNGNTVTALGPSTVDGVAVQGYQVTASPATIKAEMAKADLPAWMRSALQRVTINGVTSKVYVDAANLVRALDLRTTESVDNSGTMTIQESLSFSGYGSTAVQVTAPPATQVVTVQTVLGGSPIAGVSSTVT